jgi:hypothetical protein
MEVISQSELGNLDRDRVGMVKPVLQNPEQWAEKTPHPELVLGNCQLYRSHLLPQ